MMSGAGNEAASGTQGISSLLQAYVSIANVHWIARETHHAVPVSNYASADILFWFSHYV